MEKGAPEFNVEYAPSFNKRAGKSKKAGGFTKSSLRLEPFDQVSEFWTAGGLSEFPPGKPDDEQLPLYVFGGRIQHIPAQRNRVVKIFLSSTFSDMYVERNYLLKKIYPELTKFCKNKFNLEFQVVDMRWGVRDEASNDHSGPNICMSELASCQQLSLGPNFVCLLGQRYGSRPLQAVIDKDEFDLIIAELESMAPEEKEKSRVDVELVKTWYTEERNQTPPVMNLNPLDVMIISPDNFAAEDGPSDTLHRTLCAGAQRAQKSGKITKQDLRKYLWSVTEEEIFRGILSQNDHTVKNHALCFQRTINITEEALQHKKIHRFIEVQSVEKDGKKVNVVDQEVRGLMGHLIEETKNKLGENFVSFKPVDWSDKGGTNDDSLKDYLKNFGEEFKVKIIDLVERAATQSDPLSEHPSANTLTEILEHDHQAKAKEQTFQGREDIIKAMEKYIKSKSNQPYVMYGDSGFGKTSLMAVASIKVFDWIGDTENLLVIRRFLGTTPDSTNIGSLLYGINLSLQYFFNFKIIPTDDPNKMLHHAMMSVPPWARVVIFLDSLDQLSNYSGAHQLMWLPRTLPENVKIIVSTLPNEHGILDTLKGSIFSKRNFIQVSILNTELSLKLMDHWLKSVNRKISEEQSQIVSKRFHEDANTSPLYIKLIFDVVKQVKSYEDLAKFTALLQSINSPVKCIRYIYTELMKNMGALLVHRIFAYLHFSNLGLTENELIDLVSLDDEVLNDVFQYHVPPLRRLPATFWARIRSQVQEYLVTRESNGGKVIAWYHRQFVEVGDTMFKEEFPYGSENKMQHLVQLGAFELGQRIMTDMTDYFMGRWAGEKAKPFKYTKEFAERKDLSIDAEEIRYVPNMPNILDGGRPNRRKLGQLPTLLIKLGRLDQLFEELFGNIEGIVGLFGMSTWSEIYELIENVNFDQYKAIGKDKDSFLDKGKIQRPFNVLKRVFLLCSSVVCQHPRMLPPLLTGRLLPYGPGSSIMKNFINDCFLKGFKLNCFVATHTQLEGVSSYLMFEMPNDHEGPCTNMLEVIPGGKNFILTVSRKAVLLDMTDGSIVMKYQPPDLMKNDAFNLIAADFNSQEVIAMSLKIKPKVYLLSVKLKDITTIFDCRKVEGCENMVVQGLALHVPQKGKFPLEKQLLIVTGNAYQGVLIYDVNLQTLNYRFCNDRPILFTNIGPLGFVGGKAESTEEDALFIIITQCHKVTPIQVKYPRLRKYAYLPQLHQVLQQTPQIANINTGVIHNEVQVEDLKSPQTNKNSFLPELQQVIQQIPQTANIDTDVIQNEVQVEDVNSPQMGNSGFLSELQQFPKTELKSTPQKANIEQQVEEVPHEEEIRLQNKILNKDREFHLKDEEVLNLPGDALVVCKASNKSRYDSRTVINVFSTDDGFLYANILNKESIEETYRFRSVWNRVLLDSPAHSISMSAEDDIAGEEYPVLGVCTKEYFYMILMVKNSTFSQFAFEIRMKVKRKLSFISTPHSEGPLIGYNLGQLYYFHSNEEMNLTEVLKFDAHAKPITGIIINKDISTMVLTSDAGGSVRVFYLGKSMSDEVKELNKFDRMGTPIQSIHGYCDTAITSSQNNSNVGIWSLSEGKITLTLCHELSDDDNIKQVVTFDKTAVTATQNGVISFWKLDEVENEIKTPFSVLEVVDFKRMSVDDQMTGTLLIQCESSWLLYDAPNAQLIAEEQYENVKILKHLYHQQRLVMLAHDLEGNFGIEIIEPRLKDKVLKISLLKDAPYADIALTVMDFYCYDDILVISYRDKVVMYNWRKATVLDTLQAYKSTLVGSNTGVFLVRYATNLVSYRIKEGNREKMSSRSDIDKHDCVKLNPNGKFLVIQEGNKMIKAFKSDQLSKKKSIGIYSLYGDLEKFTFSADSNHVLLSVADTRLFILMLADPDADESIMKKMLVGEDVGTKLMKRAIHLIDSDGTDGNDSDDENSEFYQHNKQINELSTGDQFYSSLYHGNRLNVLHNAMNSDQSSRMLTASIS